MLTQQRKQLILQVLESSGQVMTKDVAQLLGFSEDTIRRDISELESEGAFKALTANKSNFATALSSSRSFELQANSPLAIAAMRCIKPETVVLLEGGETSRLLARYLPKSLSLTVVTPSPELALELVNHEFIQVILIGGLLCKSSKMTVGSLSKEMLSNLHIDLYLMEISGMTIEEGLSDGLPEMASMKKSMSSHSAETWVMVRNQQIGRVYSHTIFSCEDVDGFILERAMEGEIKESFKSLATKIVWA